MAFTPSPALFPFESRYFQSSVGRVHYVDEGAGRPILMCHGNPTWSFLYRHVILALRDSFRCVAVDYPGFGLSERPPGYGYTAAEHAAVVTELVRELDLTDAIVMGHDWGGPIGLSAATTDPDRFTGIVLGNTWFWPLDGRGRRFGKVMSRPRPDAVGDRAAQLLRRAHPAGRHRPRPFARGRCRALPSGAADAGGPGRGRRVPAPAERRGAVAGGAGRGGPAAPGKEAHAGDFPDLRDVAFPAKAVLPRIKCTFEDIEVVELPEREALLRGQQDARTA